MPKRLFKIILVVLFAALINVRQLSALPEVDQVISGNVEFVNIDANTLQINATDKAIVNYKSFDIQENESVIFNLPNISNEILNRVTGGSASSILGSLTANGVVILVNENGIFFGPRSHIDVQGLIASTRDITNEDFLSSKYNFQRMSKEQLDSLLLMQGNINIREGGFGVFIAGAVENQGTIICPMGTIAIGGADMVKLDISNGGHISVLIEKAVAEKVYDVNGNPVTDQIRNSGQIQADGGVVLLNAESLPDIFEHAINLDGIVKADRIEGKDGLIKIVSSGKVAISGEVKATDIVIGDIEVAVPESVTMNNSVLKGENSVKIAAERLNVATESPLTYIYKGNDIKLTSSVLEDNGLITLMGEDISVTYVKANDITLETAGVLDTQPGLIIQANSVKLIANKFGTTNTPVHINANNTYIQRLSGNIDILESLGLGTTILLRGPPDGFGEIIYSKTTNLTLEAVDGSITLSQGASISANNLYLKAAGYITNHGILEFTNLYENSYHFTTTGTLKGQNAYINDLDGAGDYGGTIYSDITENGDINVISNIIIGANYLIFMAGQDGSGSFISNGFSINSAPGYNYTLYIMASSNSTLGAIGDTQPLGGLSLIRAAGSGNPVFTMLGNIIITGNLAISANTTLSAGAYSLTVGGNWDNNGNFFAETSTVTFIGSLVSIGGTSSTQFKNLIINTSGTVTDNVGCSATGSLTITGIFSVASEKVFILNLSPVLTINANSYLSGPGTVNYSIAGVNNLIINNNGTINVANFHYYIYMFGSGYATTVPAVTYGDSSVATNVLFGVVNYFGATSTGIFNIDSGMLIIKGNLLLQTGSPIANLTVNNANTNMQIGGNLTTSGEGVETYSKGTETITFNGTSGIQTIDGSIGVFNNVTINNTGTKVQLASTLNVAGNLTIQAGSLDTSTSNYALNVNGNLTINGTLTGNGSVITVGGNWDSSAGAFTYNTSTVILIALNGNTTIATIPSGNSYDTRFYRLTINSGNNKVTWNSGNSIAVLNAFSLTGNLEVAVSKTFYVSSGSSFTINTGAYLSGAGVCAYGIYDATPGLVNNGTISIATFKYWVGQNSTQALITATSYLGDLLIQNNNAGSAVARLSAGTLTVGGNFTIAHYTDGSTITLDNSVNNTNITVGGNWDTGTRAVFISGTCTVTLTGAGKTLTIQQGYYTNGEFNNLTINGSYTFTVSGSSYGNIIGTDAASGTLNLGSASSLTIASGKTMWVYNNRRIVINTGATLGGPGTFYYGCSGTIDLTSLITNSGTISVGTFVYAAGSLSNITVPAFTYGGNLTIYNGNQNNNITAIIGPGTLTVGGQLYVWTLGTGKVATLDNSVNNTPINVAGNWNFGTQAAFIAGSSTVTFNGAAQTITTGAQAFYNLTFSGSGYKIVSGTLDVNGDLNLNSGYLALYQYNPDVYIAGNVNIANGAYLYDGSSAIVFDGITVYEDNNPWTPYLNRVIVTGSLTLASGMTVGTLTLNNGSVMDLGSEGFILNIYGNGTADVFTINAGATFNAGVSTVRYSCWSEEGVNVATVLYSSLELADGYIYNLTGDLSGANSLTGDLIIGYWSIVNAFGYSISCVNLTIEENGVLNSGSTITLSGDWINNGGTFNPGSSTVIFNSISAAQAINGSNTVQKFNNIIVDKSAQTLNIGGSTTSLILNGSLTLTSGTFNAGTADIYVAGNWVNNAIFAHNSKTVYLIGGDASITTGGTGAGKSFNNIILASSGTKTLNGDIKLDGNFGLAFGAFSAAGYNVIITGNIYHVTIENLGILATLALTTGSFGGNNWENSAGWPYSTINNPYLLVDGIISTSLLYGLSGGNIANLQYEWSSPVTISTVRIYWEEGPVWDQARGKPGAYYFQYYNGSDWVDPPDNEWNSQGVTGQEFNAYQTFALTTPVTTTRIRLVRPATNGGIAIAELQAVPATSTPVINAGSGTWQIGGSVNLANIDFNADTSIITFAGGSGAKTITSGTNQFNGIVFNDPDTNWTLQDALAAASINVAAGNLIDNGKTVTVAGDIIVANTSGVLTSTGTWIQSANGNISNPYWNNNAFNILQINNGVFSTATSTVTTKKLVLGENAVLNGAGNYIRISYPSADNFIIQGAGANIQSATLAIYISGGTNRSQNALNISAAVVLNYGESATLNMGGNWSIGSLTIFGGLNSTTDATSMSLNTGGHNLIINGNLRLGNATADGYRGKIVFLGGTHSISGDIDVDGTTTTWGYIHLNSSVLSVGGNINLSRATLNAGSSTMVLNGSGTQNITSSGQGYYNLNVNKPSGSAVLQDSLIITNNLEIISGMLNTGANTLTVSQDTTLNGGDLAGASGGVMDFNNLYINNGVFVASSAVYLSDAYTRSTGTADWLSNLSTLNIYAASQTLPADSYNNMVITGYEFNGLNFTQGATTVINGNITIDGINVFVFAGASAGTVLYISGDVSIGSNYFYLTDQFGASPSNLVVYFAGDLLSGSFTQYAGSTVVLNGAEDQQINSNSSSWTNLTINKVNSTVYFNGTNITVYGNFNISQGIVSLTAASPTLNVKGNWVNSGVFNSGTGTVAFTGAGSKTIAAGASPFNNLIFNQSGGTWTLAGNLDVNGNLTITAANLDVSPNNYTIYLGGNWLNSGIFTARNGTVIFDKASGTQTLNAGGTTSAKYFYNLTHAGAGVLQLVSYNITVTGALINSNGTFDANARAVTVTGLASLSGGTYLSKTAKQAFNGGLTVSGGTFTCSSGEVEVNGTFTVSGGVFTGATGILDVNGDVSLSGGTFNAPSGYFGVTGSFVMSGNNWFNPGSGTVTLDGNTAGHSINTHNNEGWWNFNNLVINGNGGQWNVIQMQALNLTIQAGTLSVGSGYLDVFNNTIISGGALTLTSGSIDFDGSVTLNGGNLTGLSAAGSISFWSGSFTVSSALSTFTAPATVRIDWTTLDYVAGTMDWVTNNSTARFINFGQAIPSGTYYNLNILGQSGSVFTLAGAVIVNGDFLLSPWDDVTTLNISDKSLQVAGSITINSGATLSVTSGTITCGGNWTNNGIFVHGTSTVRFTGGNATITTGGTDDNHDFYNVEIEATVAGSTKTIVGNIKANNTFRIIDAVNVTTEGITAVSITQLSGSGTSTFGALTATGGAISLTAANFILNGNITANEGLEAGSVTITGPVTLGNNITVSTTGADTDDITFTSTINGSKTLILNAGINGDIVVSGAIGASSRLLGFIISGGDTATLGAISTVGGNVITLQNTGTTTLNGNFVTNNVSGGAVTITGPVVLGASITINTNGTMTSDGNVIFSSTINGPWILTITAGSATVSFMGNIGSTVSLVSLSVTAATINLSGNITTGNIPNNNITFSGAVNLNNNVTINTNNSNYDGNVSFSSTVNGARELTINAGSGSVVFSSAVGSVTPLTTITVTGGFVSLMAITTTGSQVYNGSITFYGNLTLNTAGSITLNGPVMIAPGSAITVWNKGALDSDDIIFTSTVGGVQSLTLRATSLGDISVAGAINFTFVTRSFTVSGGDALTLNSINTNGGAVTLQNTGITTLNGNITTDNNSGMSGAVVVTGPAILGANVIIDTNTTFVDGNVTFYSTLDGGFVLSFDAGGGTITFGNNVGTTTPLAGLTITTAGTVTAPNAITAGNLTITQGTFNAGSSVITISGNFSNSGTFNSGSSVIIFTGSSTSTISGNNSFYRLTCTTAGKVLEFTAGSTTTVTNLLTITGASGNRITLKSTVDGSLWNLNTTGATVNVSHANIQDSSSTIAITPVLSHDLGNNTNWNLVSYLAITSSTGSISAGTPLIITITAFDQIGEVALSYRGTKNLVFSGLGSITGYNPTINNIALGTATPLDFSNGTVNATLIAYKPETATLDTTDSTYTSTGHGLLLNVGTAAAHSLEWIIQPKQTADAGIIWQVFSLRVLDAYGNVYTVPVAITLSSNIGSLSGTTVLMTNNGTAQFNNIAYNLAQIITLTASSGNCISATAKVTVSTIKTEEATQESNVITSSINNIVNSITVPEQFSSMFVQNISAGSGSNLVSVGVKAKQKNPPAYSFNKNINNKEGKSEDIAATSVFAAEDIEEDEEEALTLNPG